MDACLRPQPAQQALLSPSGRPAQTDRRTSAATYLHICNRFGVVLASMVDDGWRRRRRRQRTDAIRKSFSSSLSQALLRLRSRVAEQGDLLPRMSRGEGRGKTRREIETSDRRSLRRTSQALLRRRRLQLSVAFDDRCWPRASGLALLDGETVAHTLTASDRQVFSLASLWPATQQRDFSLLHSKLGARNCESRQCGYLLPVAGVAGRAASSLSLCLRSRVRLERRSLAHDDWSSTLSPLLPACAAFRSLASIRIQALIKQM